MPYNTLLLSYLKNQGITQVRLALEHGFDPCYISKALRGYFVPSARVQDIIAGALGFSGDQIIWQKGSPATLLPVPRTGKKKG